MPRKKPIGLLVIGILNLVFGSINLISILCCSIFLVAAFVGLRSLYNQVPPEDQRELDGLWQAFSANVPGLVPFLIASIVVSLILGVMQFVSGWGLVKIQNWARWTCAVWGLLVVVTVTASLFYEVAYVFPGIERANKDLEKWARRQEERQRRMGQQPGPRQNFGSGGTGNPITDNFLSIFFSVINLAYGAVAFIIMVLPQTGAAIARYHRPEDELAEPDKSDYYDEDFERQRRRLEELPRGGDDARPPGGAPPPRGWEQPPPGSMPPTTERDQ
jgi:hypothetical protein